MQRIRVLVVDDHRIFAESLAAALAAEQDVEVTAAGSAPAALRCLERGAADGHRFDVALIDADLAAPPAPPGASSPPASSVSPVPSGQSAHTAPRVPAPAQPNGAQPAVREEPALGGAALGGARTAPGPLGAPAPLPVPAAAAVSPAVSSGVPSPVVTAAPPAPSPLYGAPPQEPRPGGVPLVARARAEHPQVRTVVLAARDDPRHAAAALQAGAGGWVAKDCSLSRLLQVIRGVLRDETHLSPSLLTGVLKELTASRRHRTESERLVESLTPREREVLRCMVAGLGRKAVAERLFLSPHTVRTHMQNVLGKLGVHSTLAAVALARRAGVGPVELEPSAGAGAGVR